MKSQIFLNKLDSLVVLKLQLSTDNIQLTYHLGDYIAWSWVHFLGSETTHQMREIAHKFDHRADGMDIKTYTQMNCQSLAKTFLDFQLSRAYVNKYFSPLARVEVNLSQSLAIKDRLK